MALGQFKKAFRRARQAGIRLWRMGFVIPRLLRYNPYTGFIGRKFFQYIPFLLPHDKSYYGFAHLVKPGDGLFLDVGANDGISAIGFRHIHSDYRIISIEPNPCHDPDLQRLKRKLKNFDYKLIGAGKNRSQVTLYIPLYQGVPIYTAASMNKEYVSASMEEQHLHGVRDKHIMIVEYKVDIIPLDELQLQPDIIKIDTEGYDYQALLGLSQTIATCRPSILIEHNPGLLDEVMAFFKGLDYALLTYDPSKDLFKSFDRQEEFKIYSSNHITTNIFCLPREKVKELKHKLQE